MSLYSVAGLLVGAVAFAISLVRDRLYAQDYSDVEYIAATLTTPTGNGIPAAQHSHWAAVGVTCFRPDLRAP